MSRGRSGESLITVSDVKDVNGSSSSTIPNRDSGSTAEEEARRTSTEKFERFLQAGKKCMVHLVNNSCESPAGEHLRIEGDFIFENNELIVYRGSGFYCSRHAFLGLQALRAGHVEGDDVSDFEMALIALRAGADQDNRRLNQSRIRLLDKSQREFKRKEVLALQDLRRAQQRLQYLELENSQSQIRS